MSLLRQLPPQPGPGWMEFMCLDHQPLSVVEDIGFKCLVNCLGPLYMLPSRKYFTDECLPELHQTIYSHIQSLMKDDKIVLVGFTSDIWSSSMSPMSMLSLTAQFIDEKFELKRVVLHSQHSFQGHTWRIVCYLLHAEKLS